MATREERKEALHELVHGAAHQMAADALNTDDGEDFLRSIAGWSQEEINEHIASRLDPAWLTMGEFREKTAHLPDDFPITADGQGLSHGPSWYNLELIEVPTTEDLNGDERPASLLLNLLDTFDTRQW